MQISIPLYVVTPFKGLCHLPLHSPLSMLRVALVVSHPLVSLSCANPTRDSRRDSIYVPYGGPRPCFCCSRSRVLLHVSRYDPLCMEGKFGRPEPITIFGKKSVFDLGLIWDIFLRSCHCCGLWDSPSTRTYDSGSKIPICKVPRVRERERGGTC